MLTQICPIQNREKYLLSVMLAITLLFANLSKLVAICNILSKYCLCQNRKPFSDLPRQRCAHNCLPTTLHGPHRGEAYSQHCTIVGRRRALRSVAWWGVGWPLSAAIQSRAPLLGNLCKFGCGAHRCVSAATIQHHFRILPPGLGTLSGTKATQYNHYFPHKITDYF